MSIFLLDIAGVLEISAVAAGLWLLHLASKEAGAFLPRLAAWVLIAGGLIIGACTLYYGIRSRSLGYWDQPPMMSHSHLMGSGADAYAVTLPAQEHKAHHSGEENTR